MGAELCATHHEPSPNPSDCVRATDQTFKGVLDITSRVEIGDPVEKSQQHWSVPYNVVDEAGNKAATAWRDVVVEEVDIFDLEHKVRRELMAENQKAIQKAVDKALAFAKSQEVKEQATKNSSTKSQCPVCPECKSETLNEFDVSKCDQYCKANYKESCPNTAGQHSFFSFLWSFTMFDVAMTGFLAIVAIIVIRFVCTLLYNPTALFGTTDYNYAVEPRITSGNMDTTLYSSPPPTQTPNQSIMSQQRHFSDGPVSRRPPEGGLFSPPANRFSPGGVNGNGSSLYGSQQSYQSPYQTTPRNGSSNNDYSIYADDDIISPSKTGVSRRMR